MKKHLSAKIDGRQMNDTEIINAVLENRQINNITEFLHPTEADLIPFEKLKGIEEAADIINRCADMDGNFLVYFDVDADGISAGTIATKYLQVMGANVKTHIGIGKVHGLKNLPLDKLEDVDVLIIVDSIDEDVRLYENVLDQNVVIIVIDHHIIPQSLIEENLDITLVSCMNDYPNTALSGSAVTWKVFAYLDYLNLTNYADDLVDLAAVGLVGDMMDLSVPENRYICYKGFNNLQNSTIKQIIGGYEFNSESVSFSISPLINACMRTNNNDAAMKMFISEDKNDADRYIKIAKSAKEEQQEMVDSIIDALMEQGYSQIDKKCKVFWIPEEYQGITGLLGNKMMAEWQCPVLIVHPNDDNDMITGSARAVGVENFSDIINQTGLAISRGHENASGFECDVEKFNQCVDAIEEQLKDVEFCTEIEADIELFADQINENLIKQIKAINQISGTGCPAIKVLIRTKDYEVSTFSSQKHLKIIDKSGVIIVKWNCMDWETMDNNGEVIAVGTLAAPWYGRKKFLQLTIDDYTKQND